MRRALFAAWLSVALAVLLPRVSRADGDPNHSPYEQASIQSALASLHGKIEPEPEGKIIEGIEIVPLDVIEQRDPLPNFLNWFHWTTRRYVIEREILVHKGELYNTDKVDETARN